MKLLSFQVVREGEREREREREREDREGGRGEGRRGGGSEGKGGDHLGRGGRVSKCGTTERGQLGVCVRAFVCCHLCERMSLHLCVCVCVCVCEFVCLVYRGKPSR